MAYVFQAVDIFAFDLHVTVNPLADSSLVVKDYGYLVDPDLYRAQYESGKFLETSNFIIRPLTWRSHHKRNYFWQPYIGMWPAGKVDYWGLQIPFSLKPKKKHKIELDTTGKSFRVSVSPMIYLWSFGWSTNLNIYVRGEITPKELQELIASIRAVDKTITPFAIAGAQYNLSGVFQYFSDLIRKEVYVAEGSLGESNPVKRYLVTSLAQYTGPLDVYSRDASAIRMPDGDRLMLYNILEGRSLTLDDLEKIEQNKLKYLVTQHNPPDFFEPDLTLTRFDFGTLMFIQRLALGEAKDPVFLRKTRKRLRCLASNIRLFLVENMALLNFIREASESFGDESGPDYGSTEINKRLQHNSKAMLRRLPERYKNSFSTTFYKHYKPLQDLAPTTKNFKVS
jgi:hypothetical protein